MLNFYIPAALIALAAVALMVRPLILGRSSAGDRGTTDVQVFRDQLDEVERDLARGTIGESEAEGARVEISRRLIAASHRAERSGTLMPAPRGPTGMVAGMLLIGVPALGALVYFSVGVPGAPDRPFAERTQPGQTRMADGERPSQAEAEARITPEMRQTIEQEPEYVALVEQLRDAMAKRPGDEEGQRLLATGLMRLGRWVEARKAFDRLIEMSDAPIAAETHANAAEAMVLAAGGYVSPEAEQAIANALKLDPKLPMARYYAGLALRQSGRLDDAIRIWEDLRRETPADAPYLEWVNMVLAETIRMRDGPRGPSREDIAAANDMSAEDRATMIESMVQRLEDRLTSEGGEAEEWLRLINAYVQLDRKDDALRVYRLSEDALKDDDAASFVKEQALLLGVIPE